MAETKETAAAVTGAALLGDNSGPSDIKPATEFSPSGAPRQIVDDVDPKHPAVDNNPREFTTVNQNKIDFNDPDMPGDEAVAKALEAQGTKFVADDSADKAKK